MGLEEPLKKKLSVAINRVNVKLLASETSDTNSLLTTPIA
jgi:hypothetical protein